MNKITKTIAGFVAVAAFAVVAVSPASALTVAELQAQIAALTAQLSSMSGASASASATFTRDLSQGSTGADVTALQNWLISQGQSIPAGATGTFGAQTAAAVKAWQASKGLPATGYFGPMSRAAANASAGTGSTGTGSTGTGSTGTGSTSSLAGTDGSISDVNELSQYNNEEVGEGEEDVKVAGFEVEASNDGDIAIRSAKVSFTITNASGSDNLDDYVDTVKVWAGSKEVGSADAGSFTEGSSGVWTKTITLSNPVIKSDKTEKFYVTVDGAGSFDTGDIDSESITVDVENLRFEDGSGVVTTETGYDLDGMDVAVSFVSFGTAADTELKLSKSSDSPSVKVVRIDEDDNTDNVLLLKGKMKLEGTSDVVLDEFPVTFTTTGDSVAAIASSVTLKLGDEEYSETVSISGATTGTITFDNLDFDIEAGDTVEFQVLADINDVENTGVTATDFDEGDTLKAEVTSTNRNYMDVENQEGDQLDDTTEKSGTSLGNAQEFRTTGMQLTLVSTSAILASAGTNSNDDQGTLTIKFKVKADGDTIYMSSAVDANGSTTGSENDAELDYVVERGTVATVGGVSGTLTMVNMSDDSDDDLTSVGNYTIEDGEERTFELVVTAQLPSAGLGGQYRLTLSDVPWSTADDTAYNEYTSNLGSFKTSYVSLN